MKMSFFQLINTSLNQLVNNVTQHFIYLRQVFSVHILLFAKEIKSREEHFEKKFNYILHHLLVISNCMFKSVMKQVKTATV